jgi:hypothetical protein
LFRQLEAYSNKQTTVKQPQISKHQQLSKQIKNITFQQFFVVPCNTHAFATAARRRLHHHCTATKKNAANFSVFEKTKREYIDNNENINMNYVNRY